MDEAAAEAMWADGNINITQQQIIKRHFRYHFGKRIFIAERKLLQSVAIILSLHSMESISTIKKEAGLRNLKSVPFGPVMHL